jgi:predicted Zn-dependent protease
MDGLPPRATLAMALDLLRQNRALEAVPVLEAVLEDQPANACAALNLAMARMDLGRLDLSAAPLERALRGLPQHPEPHFRVGRLAHLRGDVEGAL